MIRISVSDFRKDVSEALNQVAYKKERIAIQRHGKDVAAVVPVEDIELLRLIEDRDDLRAARKARKEVNRSGAIPLSEVKKQLNID